MLLTVTEDRATQRCDPSAVTGFARRVMPGQASLFLHEAWAITLLGKPQSDKPRVRAEPDAPKAPLRVKPFALTHGLLAVDHNGIGVMHDPVAYGVGQYRIAYLLTPARDIEL